MTVVVVLTVCPPKLHGDMTKWFVEVNTGVYIGNLSAKVRDELWERIIANVADGHATMMFTTVGEQHMDFRVHNAYWEVTDFDGIKLMRHPISDKKPSTVISDNGRSPKAHLQVNKLNPEESNKWERFCASHYVVLDIETTGLDENQAEIIEIGALLVEDDMVSDTFHTFIKAEDPIPVKIQALTGITDDILNNQGISLRQGIMSFIDFSKDFPLVCHNAPFEQAFFTQAMKKTEIAEINNCYIDTLSSARELIPGLSSYKLSSLSEYLSVDVKDPHRSLADCEMTLGVYQKLKELAISNCKKARK